MELKLFRVSDCFVLPAVWINFVGIW